MSNSLIIATVTVAVVSGIPSLASAQSKAITIAEAQAERDWREWRDSLRRYGSDRDSSGTEAQAERDWREWQGSVRRYGSDRVYSPSSAQAERDYREWLESLRAGNGGRSYGNDRYIIDDPDYAEFKLKKAFESNWTTAENSNTP